MRLSVTGAQVVADAIFQDQVNVGIVARQDALLRIAKLTAVERGHAGSLDANAGAVRVRDRDVMEDEILERDGISLLYDDRLALCGEGGIALSIERRLAAHCPDSYTIAT